MSAVISSCGRWRYELVRELSEGAGPTIGWCLHNPSTADAEKDDPTSRRGISFSRAWGAKRMIFVNLWAGRATKPSDLWKMNDPLGPENDWYVERVARECVETEGFMVLGWGAIKNQAVRVARVKKIIFSVGCPMRVLGLTRNRQPKHPLYIASNTPLTVIE